MYAAYGCQRADAKKNFACVGGKLGVVRKKKQKKNEKNGNCLMVSGTFLNMLVSSFG